MIQALIVLSIFFTQASQAAVPRVQMVGPCDPALLDPDSRTLNYHLEDPQSPHPIFLEVEFLQHPDQPFGVRLMKFSRKTPAKASSALPRSEALRWAMTNVHLTNAIYSARKGFTTEFRSKLEASYDRYLERSTVATAFDLRTQEAIGSVKIVEVEADEFLPAEKFFGQRFRTTHTTKRKIEVGTFAIRRDSPVNRRTIWFDMMWTQLIRTTFSSPQLDYFNSEVFAQVDPKSLRIFKRIGFDTVKETIDEQGNVEAHPKGLRKESDGAQWIAAHYLPELAYDYHLRSSREEHSSDRQLRDADSKTADRLLDSQHMLKIVETAPTEEIRHLAKRIKPIFDLYGKLFKEFVYAWGPKASSSKESFAPTHEERTIHAGRILDRNIRDFVINLNRAKRSESPERRLATLELVEQLLANSPEGTHPHLSTWYAFVARHIFDPAEKIRNTALRTWVKILARPDAPISLATKTDEIRLAQVNGSSIRLLEAYANEEFLMSMLHIMRRFKGDHSRAAHFVRNYFTPAIAFARIGAYDAAAALLAPFKDFWPSEWVMLGFLALVESAPDHFRESIGYSPSAELPKIDQIPGNIEDVYQSLKWQGDRQRDAFVRSSDTWAPKPIWYDWFPWTGENPAK